MFWTYEKPTEAGLYLISSSDAVTEYSVHIQSFDESMNDVDGVNISRYKGYVKYLKLNASDLNAIPTK